MKFTPSTLLTLSFAALIALFPVRAVAEPGDYDQPDNSGPWGGGGGGGSGPGGYGGAGGPGGSGGYGGGGPPPPPGPPGPPGPPAPPGPQTVEAILGGLSHLVPLALLAHLILLGPRSSGDSAVVTTTMERQGAQMELTVAISRTGIRNATLMAIREFDQTHTLQK
ncbi:hypothetical protein BJ165DRAFT_1121569 [Panaeolus papilionaceus]|nr:hypothetical protein BJ165DRAFT_1121569 [Panaeolus papilionaceus]